MSETQLCFSEKIKSKKKRRKDRNIERMFQGNAKKCFQFQIFSFLPLLFLKNKVSFHIHDCYYKYITKQYGHF